MTETRELLKKLFIEHSLEAEEYLFILKNITDEEREYLFALSRETREKIYGRDVFIRGLCEISSICKNDCLYCGLRASNKGCQRYRLTEEDILSCCSEGYGLGFRTFVLQGGEDGYFTDERLIPLIKEIKRRHPDCAVTLSLGERSFESYKNLKNAGADRYLLRHETSSEEHYAKLHPENLTLKNRLNCLENLRALGYQVGCGFMVGSPFQTTKMLSEELKFIEEFKPDMCGIGPFIPHRDTPFRDFPAGSVELTVTLLALIRLIHPRVLLPATTALGTLSKDGRDAGILAGANVVMPNLSPKAVRKKYMLYDNKLSDGDEAAEAIASLSLRIKKIGYNIVTSRGDIIK